MTTNKKKSNRIKGNLNLKNKGKFVAYHTGFNTEDDGVYTKGCCYFCKRVEGENESIVFINGQRIEKSLGIKHYCFPVRDLIYMYPICDECCVILSVFAEPIESGLKVLGDEESG